LLEVRKELFPKTVCTTNVGMDDVVCLEDNIYIINVVEYIVWFMVREVQRIMVCDTCLDILEQNHCNLGSLIAIKNKGGVLNNCLLI